MGPWSFFRPVEALLSLPGCSPGKDSQNCLIGGIVVQGHRRGRVVDPRRASTQVQQPVHEHAHSLGGSHYSALGLPRVLSTQQEHARIQIPFSQIPFSGWPQGRETVKSQDHKEQHILSNTF